MTGAIPTKAGITYSMKYKEIVKYFVDFRLKYYDKRKAFILAKLSDEIKSLDNKSRFIKGIIDKKILINNVPKASIESTLDTMKFDKIDGSYDYLLRMPIHTLTKEKYEELLKQLQEKRDEHTKISAIKPLDMYKEDLITLRKVIEKEFK